jgi:hypothetical protein
MGAEYRISNTEQGMSKEKKKKYHESTKGRKHEKGKTKAFIIRDSLFDLPAMRARRSGRVFNILFKRGG